MRKCGLLSVALALSAISFAGALATTTSAGALAALVGMGSERADRPSGLIVKIKKKKHCTVVFVCDFFNPATSCASPPCCKKGHIEKDCEPVDGAPATTPAQPPDPASGQCNLCTNKGDCTPAGSPAECQVRKATAEQGTVTPFLKWSCSCK